MPLVEVIYSGRKRATTEEKRALMHDLADIFADVLGTPQGRLQVLFFDLDWEDSITNLLSGDQPDNAPASS